MYVVIAWPPQAFSSMYSENDEENRKLRGFRDWLKAGAQVALFFIERSRWWSDFQFLESPSYSTHPLLTSDLEQAFKFQSLRKAEEVQKHVENPRVLMLSQAEQYVAKRGY